MGGSPHDVGVLTRRDALSLGASRRLAVGPDGVLYFCDLDNSGSGASICAPAAQATSRATATAGMAATAVQ